MLKVTYLETLNQRTLVVEGMLAGPWVAELETAWIQVREARRNGKIVVDLSGATVIDAKGKTVLMAMVGEGVELVAKCVFTKFLVEVLTEVARRARCRF